MCETGLDVKVRKQTRRWYMSKKDMAPQESWGIQSWGIQSFILDMLNWMVPLKIVSITIKNVRFSNHSYIKTTKVDHDGLGLNQG